ncbi:MAG: hypothetical protein F6K21_29000 [Symploca sp. SIO2D2]|nr:hypothetical protein [Symploca sp. SIO2D2]
MIDLGIGWITPRWWQVRIFTRPTDNQEHDNWVAARKMRSPTAPAKLIALTLLCITLRDKLKSGTVCQGEN